MELKIESHSVGVGESNGDYLLHKAMPNGVTLLVLADGMSGLSSPEIASRVVCHAIAEYMDTANVPDRIALIRRAISYADQRLAEVCKERKCKMGVAFTLLYFCEDRLLYASLGDVRLYHKNREGEIAQLSEDHVIVQGEETFLTACVSGRGFRIPLRVKELPLRIGDAFLLCSDGYYQCQDIYHCFPPNRLPAPLWIEDDSSVVRIEVF